MLPVSEEFLEKIKAGRRNIVARVEVVWTDTQIDESIRVSNNEEARTSWDYQVADGVENTTHKWASLDGSWKLGEYHLAPGSRETADDYQMGWWGKQFSDENGEFSAPYPTLTVSFFARPVYSLKVVGDNAREEWPIDFDINVYSGSELLYKKEVRDNPDIFWQGDVVDEELEEVTRMELVIYKWSEANRQAKIIEFFTSVRAIYEDDDILQVNLLEEREVSDGSLPIGNITSNELDIRLNNINGEFFAGNEDSPLFGLVKKNRRIRAWLGIELDSGVIEYQPLGVFWSGDWNAPEQEVYAETTARDRLQLMDESEFESSKVIEDTDLYELAEIIFDDYGLDDDQYWIDDELKEFQIPYGYFEPMSHREALRKIAEACVGQVYADRRGVVRVEGPSFLDNLLENIGGDD
ncbi:hypothetical protein MWH25_01455 [Natroniella acetigena]|uniref:hypothetical protein n=1 Tax=Natroniella acetigena TaxID=52004 RepID=UPI00200B2A8C|nr:hypothetical protein [Natroniella acetigena]MCK8826414.1 hypothetical protein [Natroniella acetigena]